MLLLLCHYLKQKFAKSGIYNPIAKILQGKQFFVHTLDFRLKKNV